MIARDAAGTARVALVIAGAHRSGTSALARVLSLLGAQLPRDVMGAGVGNPAGHWEPARIAAANDTFLRGIGSDWDDSHALPAEWLRAPAAEGLIGEATTLISEEYGSADLIVLKDPRLCRLAPVYAAALERAGFSPHFVIALRHPAEVVRSLLERNQLDPRIGEMMWIRHLLEIEQATRGRQHLWTGYAELLSDWRGVQARIASGFGIVWPRSPAEASAEIDGFLAPSLRHFDIGRDDQSQIGLLAARLWHAAVPALEGDDGALRAACDAVRAVLDEVDRLTEGQRVRERTRLLAFEEVARVRDVERPALTRALDQREQLAIERDAAERKLASVEAASAEREAEHARALSAAEARITALLASNSWRLTAPVRALSRRVLRPRDE